MADSERYTLEDKSETVTKIKELQSDGNAIVQKIESGDMNVNQVLSDTSISHVEKYLSKKQMRKLV